jgi:hypothetical protein
MKSIHQNPQSIQWTLSPFDFQGDINAGQIFFSRFEEIPNTFEMYEVDIKKISEWLEANFSDVIISKHKREKYSEKDGEEMLSTIYVFKDDIVLEIASDMMQMAYGKGTKLKADLIEGVKKFVKMEKSGISMIVQSKMGLMPKDLEIKKQDVDLSLHYNDGFDAVDDQLKRELSDEDGSGLYLLYGAPGTGKSSYIKYLIHQVNKRMVFLPPKVALNLDDFALTDFLLDNRNIILVIEDAEELLKTDNNSRTSAISMLLNLTDGILGDGLGIKIIATFNTELHQIDPALMRKGRLKLMYEFNKLSIPKSKALLSHLGIEKEVHNPMNLSEIYYLEEHQYQLNNGNGIGF